MARLKNYKIQDLSEQKNLHVQFKLAESVLYSNLGEAQNQYKIDWIVVCWCQTFVAQTQVTQETFSQHWQVW